MPQRRMISSALWSDLDFVSLTPTQRLLWLALISNADDQGRLQGHPALVRSVCMPAEDCPIEDVAANLAAISHLGWIIQYEVGGKQYIQVAKWWKYQTMSWALPSQHPAPDGWTDSLRYRVGDKVITRNWDAKPTADVPRTYDVHTGDDDERAARADNITEHNRTELKGNTAGAKSAPIPPPASLLKRVIDHATVPLAEDLDLLFTAYQKALGYAPGNSLPVGAARQSLVALLDDGRTAEDVGGCAKWLASDGSPPSLMRVCDMMQEWVKQGRPTRKANGNGRGTGRVRRSVWDEADLKKAREAEKGQPWTPPPE